MKTVIFNCMTHHDSHCSIFGVYFSELATLAEDPDSNDQWALAAKQFNESLLALEGCLRAWAAQSEKNEATTVSEEENQNTQITGVSKPSKARVPFEDSVLTKLLQKALGLNAYVYMVSVTLGARFNYNYK